MKGVAAGSVTGRDRYIILNALAYAIEAISRLPEQWQERSDQSDMIALLDAMTDEADFYRVGARGHLQQRGITVRNGQLVLKDPEPCVIVRLDSVRR
jgi:hypothetical protein